MIIDVILDSLENLFVWLGGLFPSGDINPGGNFQTFLDKLVALNYYLPISEVFGFTMGAFIVFPALAGVTLTVWLVALIRGGSARA